MTREEYKKKFREKFGEDIPDSVLNTLGSKGNKKVAEIKQKIKDHFKNKKGVTTKIKKLLKNADFSLGKDTIGLKGGGALKPVPEGNTGLAKLPTPVRNNMGFAKAGGQVKKLKKGGKVKRMSCPVDGMAKRGKTKVRRKGR